jgi:CRP/FNR family cyclic AMP-dependent transcriptional regulator
MKAEIREVVDALRRLPELESCGAAALRSLAEVGRHVRLPAHWTVVHERTPGDTCYLVLEGEAEVRRNGAPVATIGAGAMFGEASVLDRHLRNASVVAATPLDVLSLPCSELLDLLGRHPDLDTRLLADYRRRALATG